MKQIINNIKSSIGTSLTNIRGVKLNQKIVVIESDDWGSIRMPNKSIRDNFSNKGYNITNNPYCQFDTLANKEDLNKLFTTLTKFKDSNGNHPTITANTVVANPNFEEIRKSGYKKYSYKPFTTTLKEYYPTENVFGMWSEGIKSKLFKPQYHGREHLNVPLWLKQLESKNKVFLDAFNLGFWGVPRNLYNNDTFNIQAAYGSINEEDTVFYKESIKDGLKLFENIFNYKSDTFIANNYTWSQELNQTLFDNDIKGFQGMKYQKTPTGVGSKVNLTPIYTGKTNELGQIYMVRNCVFEPSQMPKSYKNVKKCLSQIENAFLFKKPAILTSHRLNYIGAIDPNNREQNLTMLEELLNQIIKRWPNVIFMSSDQLTNYLKS